MGSASHFLLCGSDTYGSMASSSSSSSATSLPCVHFSWMKMMAIRMMTSHIIPMNGHKAARRSVYKDIEYKKIAGLPHND